MSDKIKILIVDDEQIVLDSIRKHLRHEESYIVFTALSVPKAIDIIDSENINIVLTDLMMPDIDGLEFLKLIREKNDNILSVMITGYATINTALQATQLGAFDYIAKPFTKDELRKVVKRAADFISASWDKPKNEIEEDKMKMKGNLKGIGEYSWMVRQEDGTVLIGVERPFLYSIGKIQTVYLPSKGDELRQGSVYFQVFSSDLRSQSLLSPLSGNVVEVNKYVIDNPNASLQDPYNKGWLIRIDPTNFDNEIKLLGL